MRAKLALALLLSCLTCFLEAQDASETHRLTLKCLSDNGLKPENMEAFESSKSKLETAENPIKCAVHCILQKSGIIDKNGDIVMDAIKGAVPNPEKVLSSCVGIKGANACDKAIKTMNCIESLSIGLITSRLNKND